MLNLETGERIDEIKEKLDGVHINLDYYSITFPLISDELHDNENFKQKLIEDIKEFFNVNDEEIYQEEYALNRYKEQYQIGNSIVLRLDGPAYSYGARTCQLELKGDGCREFQYRTKKGYMELLNHFILFYQARVTRIDIAIDDFDGKDITFDYIASKIDKKFFTSSFRKKYYKMHGSIEDGRTMEFGNHGSSQQLVIYEKLKEQLSKNIPCLQDYWLRIELRYKGSKADDICEILRNKDEEGFKEYVYGLLKDMMDLKENNNYSIHDQKKVETDSNYNIFLNNVKKAKIERRERNKTIYETFIRYISPFLLTYILIEMKLTGYDLKEIERKCLNVVLDTLEKTNIKQKLKAVNKYISGTNYNLHITPRDIHIVEEVIKKVDFST